MLIGALGARGKSRYFGGAGLRDFAVGKDMKYLFIRLIFLCPNHSASFADHCNALYFLDSFVFRIHPHFYASSRFTNISRTRSLLRKSAFDFLLCSVVPDVAL
jgi:hypothetical protein